MKSPSTHEVRGSVALLKSAMKAADVNNDGRLSRTELAGACKQAGGDRAHASRIMLLGQIWQGSKFEAEPTLRGINARLDRTAAMLIGADTNQNNLIAYGETVKMRQEQDPTAAYKASILWGVASGH